jgi:hypothetical protein
VGVPNPNEPMVEPTDKKGHDANELVTLKIHAVMHSYLQGNTSDRELKIRMLM